MKRRLFLLANLAGAAALAGWAAVLLAHARTKVDYLKAQVHQDIPLCQPVAASDPRMSSMGLSHEPDHSWTDRRRAYLAFGLPAMPNGGELSIQVVATTHKGVQLSLSGGQRGVTVDKTGLYPLPVSAASTPRTLVLAMESQTMSPPHGQDKRWLGLAIGSIAVCPHGSRAD